MLHVQGETSSGLIATPEIVSEGVTPGLEFIILATDGLWDVVEDQVQESHQTSSSIRFLSWGGWGEVTSADRYRFLDDHPRAPLIRCLIRCKQVAENILMPTVVMLHLA